MTETSSFHKDIEDLQSETKRINGKPYTTGRKPSKFNDTVTDELCTRLCEGESLKSICMDEHMPTQGTVMRWIGESESFAQRYARARSMQAELMANEIIEIADDGTNDWMEKHNDKGEAVGWRVNGEAVQRSKLRLEARKWAAAKLLPKKYGERVEVEHSGEVASVGETDTRQLARAVLQVFSENGNDEPDQDDEESEA